MPNGGDSQHGNLDGVRVYDYGEEDRNVNAYVHRAHQKSRDKQGCGDARCLTVHSDYDAHWVFGEAVVANVSNAHNCNEEPTHANNAHPMK